MQQDDTEKVGEDKQENGSSEYKENVHMENKEEAEPETESAPKQIEIENKDEMHVGDKDKCNVSKIENEHELEMYVKEIQNSGKGNDGGNIGSLSSLHSQRTGDFEMIEKDELEATKSGDYSKWK